MDKEVLQIEQQLKSAIALLQELKDKENPSDLKAEIVENDSLGIQKVNLIQNFRKGLMESKNCMVYELNEAIKEFDYKYDKISNEIISELENEVKLPEIKSFSRIFCQKVHKNRTSLLIKMYQNEDTRTIYHIFIAIMLVMILGEMINAYYTTGVIIDLSLFTYVFGDLPLVVFCWVLMAF